MTALASYRGPVAVRSVDLARPLDAFDDVAAYDHVRVFFLWDGVPVASADLANHGRAVSAAQLLDVAVQRCAHPLLQAILADHLGRARNGVGRLPDDVPVSVVVATFDRPDQLRGCLAALCAQTTRRPLEIVVVDNHPASGRTPPVVSEFPGVILVSESRQGLAYARNAGFIAARGAVVACTDDDVVIPPGWLEALVAPFTDPALMAVTGNVLPLELDSPAQRFYEAYGGLGRGFQRRSVDGYWFRQLRGAVPTWQLGATANAAFRATVFADPAIGLMDEALGPGMPTGVGEDTYLFYKILKAGHLLVYEPSAYVWHRHRRTMSELRRQMYGYSKGHVAYHLTTLLRDGDRRALVRLAQLPRWHARQLLRWAWARLHGRQSYPLSLILLEIVGHAVGPWGLWQSRRRVGREGRSGPSPRQKGRP
jgi:glycosyltransferase involved in cell wall biosynthesis